MHTENKIMAEVREYIILTFATLLLVIGTYLFKFPNNFSFGGVAGIAVILADFVPLSAATLSFIMNMALLVVGFMFLGKGFGVKTVYVTILNSVLLSAAEALFPMSGPITDEPVLEMIFAIILQAVSSAILFDIGASSGGTDIVAMIIKKFSSFDIGTALLMVDVAVVVASCLVFDAVTGLCSLCGLMAKSLVIDNVIANLNLHKCFTIICDHPDPICEFINDSLVRSATLYKAEGAYTHATKTVIITILSRKQAVQLRKFIQTCEPTAFITITNSSEIIGKGFRGFNR